MTLVLGGSGSGKSAYAEQLLDGYSRKYYIATMQVFDAESEKRVAHHRQLRAGKGFVTVEQPRSIAQAARAFAASSLIQEREKRGMPSGAMDGMKCAGAEKGTAVLLECMSNLVANEMFGSEQYGDTDHGIDSGIAGTVSDRILKEIAELSGKVDHFVIVSNNVFEDGIDYEESTRNYIRELGHVNAGLAAMADTVVEVVVGIPVFIKQ